ncbi:mitochondrial 2-oxoglutarate/malate carrier protein [Plakobranchus ocellatus]|uniref:Mitochondrial 2-oxoglutarate/malate carrier protein n=1 Tax=Plakobranchus ocellatus TaxID=259542 RepID=A0AAV4E2L3_9GAST|nr:mitochondrial 2-oxoglutarate/malate carrier protein [Plakobranchus ocellatus]
MPRNVEIKARVRDSVSLTKRARELAGNDGIHMEQVDTFFNAREGRLKLRSVKGEKAKLIQYSRPDQNGPKLSDFHIAWVEDAESLKLETSILRHCGSHKILPNEGFPNCSQSLLCSVSEHPKGSEI